MLESLLKLTLASRVRPFDRCLDGFGFGQPCLGTLGPILIASVSEGFGP